MRTRERIRPSHHQSVQPRCASLVHVISVAVSDSTPDNDNDLIAQLHLTASIHTVGFNNQWTFDTPALSVSIQPEVPILAQPVIMQLPRR